MLSAGPSRAEGGKPALPEVREELAVSAPARGGEESRGSSEDRDKERSQPGGREAQTAGARGPGSAVSNATILIEIDLPLLRHKPHFHPDINSTVYTWKQGVGA